MKIRKKLYSRRYDRITWNKSMRDPDLLVPFSDRLRPFSTVVEVARLPFILSVRIKLQRLTINNCYLQTWASRFSFS
jgi:hypothetical protein